VRSWWDRHNRACSILALYRLPIVTSELREIVGTSNTKTDAPFVRDDQRQYRADAQEEDGNSCNDDSHRYGGFNIESAKKTRPIYQDVHRMVKSKYSTD
jgi:hypothetical protein